jgi:hypothetical protein
LVANPLVIQGLDALEPLSAGEGPVGEKLLPVPQTVVELGDDDVRLSHMGPDGNTEWGFVMWAYTDVAYSTWNDEFLVVWVGDDDDFGMTVLGEAEVLGQRVSATTGQPVGPPLRISFMGPDGSTEYAAQNPAVAYNSAANEHLVVWHGDHDADLLVDNESEIWGQRIDAATGALIGSNFRISHMGPDGYGDYDAFRPDVAYSRASDLYQVVWYGDDIIDGMVNDEFEIFGRKVNPDGSFPEAQVRLTRIGPDGDADYDALDPAVAWASDTNMFLVVFQGKDDVLASGEHEIFGELVDGVATGSHVVSSFRISWMGPGGDLNCSAASPAVAHNPRRHHFLVVWRGDSTTPPHVNNEFEIWGRGLGNDGSLIDAQRVLSEVGPPGDPDFRVDDPQVGFNRNSNSFLVVWSGSTSLDSLEYEVYGRAVTGEPGANDPLTAQRLSSMGPDGATTYATYFAGLAVSPSTGRALVVWWGDDDVGGLIDNEFEIFGQLAVSSGLFVDGFESGDTRSWRTASP